MPDDGISADNVVALRERTRQAWKNKCQIGAHGVLKCNLTNAMMALRFDHDLRDCYGFDEMQRVPVVLREIAGTSANRWLKDGDAITLQCWMQDNGFTSMGLDTVRDALKLRCDEQPFHPVRDYLHTLEWDGVSRIGVWLPRYLGASFNHYTQHIGRMFLVSMVARIASPGCQADHMLVLEGPQGQLKSSACRVLGGEWFSDHLPEVSAGKAASEHLRGKWLIEVAEMHAMNKVEATQLKSFITRTTERYRPTWGRQEVHEPRQCVFVGTTNEDAYLKDASGGRRFWPVKTGAEALINLETLAADRDQLFAEAVSAYRAGDNWWPDRSFEAEMIAPEQQARYAGDIWEGKIAKYIADRRRVTTSEIATECLGLANAQQSSATAQRIGMILRERGWGAKRSNSERWWERLGDER